MFVIRVCARLIDFRGFSSFFLFSTFLSLVSLLGVASQPVTSLPRVSSNCGRPCLSQFSLVSFLALAGRFFVFAFCVPCVFVLGLPWMVRGHGLMLRPKLGFDTIFSSHHETKGGWLPWICFTISFGDCWFILLGNQTVSFLATFLLETWRVLSCSWWRSLSPWPWTAHLRSVCGTMCALLPGLILPDGMVPFAVWCVCRVLSGVCGVCLLVLRACFRGSMRSPGVPT